eukprot:CAMPEP_0181195058 /NCGR_PEP_ID=MMETSP1096-20121128/14673_1 /TAXON_ID=156174 ORGANISM="Chrysochromulina ericina, Strain CCMP281" /NCGR_SAMPLE_ID=MMETSP1096 /ASSEMBLY_ACC=CAM_ASM_000453 /LENGTH=131 /DNA_ID=CAMNT_0023284613 /DNA_START=530 /DNA_END=925 /DNA_ORIENTATION=+
MQPRFENITTIPKAGDPTFADRSDPTRKRCGYLYLIIHIAGLRGPAADWQGSVQSVPQPHMSRWNHVRVTGRGVLRSLPHVDVEPIGAIVQSNGRLGCVTEDVWMPTIIHRQRPAVWITILKPNRNGEALL